MARKLTPNQVRFVEEYLKDLNATQACIRAGYSAKTADRIGPELLGKPWVRDAIQEKIAARSKRTEVTTDWVLKKLVENVERAMQTVQVLDREGEPTGQYQYEGAVANQGLNLIGKHLGMFEERLKHEHTGPDGKPIAMKVASELHIPDRAAFAAFLHDLTDV